MRNLGIAGFQRLDVLAVGIETAAQMDISQVQDAEICRLCCQRVDTGFTVFAQMPETAQPLWYRFLLSYPDGGSQWLCAAEDGRHSMLCSEALEGFRLTVYRKDDLEMYQYSFADFYVNRVSINTDGTRTVVSGLSAKNGSLLSVLYVLDFSQGNYMQRYEFDEIYIYDVKYLDNGNAVAVGDKAAYYIDINGGSKKNIDYHSRFLTTYTLDRQKGMFLSLSSTPDGRECEVFMTDENGKNGADIMTNRLGHITLYPSILGTDSIAIPRALKTTRGINITKHINNAYRTSCNS